MPDDSHVLKYFEVSENILHICGTYLIKYVVDYNMNSKYCKIQNFPLITAINNDYYLLLIQKLQGHIQVIIVS